MDLSLSSFFPLPPSEVFSTLVEELSRALGGVRLTLEPKEGGRLLETSPKGAPREVAKILEWDPGEGIVFEWHPPEWARRSPTMVRVQLVPERGGTRVTIEHRGFGQDLLTEKGEELVGWFASEVASTLFQATSPDRLADWVTDRQARRPSGRASREAYRDPIYHRPNFAALLEGLKLTKDDDLLEVGCGGGAFLHDALQSGCRAAAIDHSVDLLHVAEEQNQDAISEERLTLVRSEADQVPFEADRFSCAVMTGVLGFLPKAPETFREIFRTLRPGGRLAVFAGSKAMRGTPAAPEPIASRLHWYTDREMAALARGAGFTKVRVEHPDLRKFAKLSGAPEEAFELFKGRACQLLWAEKPVYSAPRPRSAARFTPRASRRARARAPSVRKPR